MSSTTAPLTRIEADQLKQALLAGIARVLSRRDYINSINVFPVPDSDTGTNLAFTLVSVRKSLVNRRSRNLSELLKTVADSALDGARGNSGAIMAQYFQGLSESASGLRRLDSQSLAQIAGAGARSAWQAMSEPVAGTLPTVLEDFADELNRLVADGTEDIRDLFRRGLERARQSLAGTPAQLAVLREAGVVDAGAQGFVDMLEGIWAYIRSGRVPEIALPTAAVADAPALAATEGPEHHRFCTEALIEGQAMDIASLRHKLEALDASSLVVAGGMRRARVHIHTDSPGEVFRICAEHGDIRQQKADDMTRQHQLLNQTGRVAIVTDSAADLPVEEADRLGIHIVPVRLNFGEEEFLDKLTIAPADFYRRLADPSVVPKTSQPPPADFRRQYELLTSHGLEVLSIHLSARLSGTLQAAQQAAGRSESGLIEVFDTRNGACGQALMVLYAAEAAARGWDIPRIVERLEQIGPKTRTFTLIHDLSWGVRGGRVKPWMEALTRRLGIRLILGDRDGRLGPQSALFGQRRLVQRFARYLSRHMNDGEVYRVLISHTDAIDDARLLRDELLASHPRVDACWLEDASPAIGAHAGPGSLIVGLQPYSPPEAPRD